jgi:hypothetical protein
MKSRPLATITGAAFVTAPAKVKDLSGLSRAQRHFSGFANKPTRTDGKTLHITAFRWSHDGSI